MTSDSKFDSSTRARNLVRNAFIAFFFFLILAINWIFLQSATKYLLDFGSFMASGIAAANGQNPYSTDSPLIMRVFFNGVSTASPNLNPPITVLLFESISRLNPFIALKIWRILSAIGYVLSIIALAIVYRNSLTLVQISWAICLAGFWHTLQLGQIYILLLIFVVTFWILSKKNHLILAGIALGILISIKPNFLYWAILLGIGGYWSVFFTTALTATILSILPLLIYGPSIYVQWLTIATGPLGAGLLLPGNSSLQSLSLHFFGDVWLGTALSIVFAFLGIYATICKRSDIQTINYVGIIISLLISPIAWAGYTIFTLPIFLAKERWAITDRISAILFAIPIWVIFAITSISQLTFHVFGWAYGWGLLFLLVGVFVDKKPGGLKRVKFQS